MQSLVDCECVGVKAQTELLHLSKLLFKRKGLDTEQASKSNKKIND